MTSAMKAMERDGMLVLDGLFSTRLLKRLAREVLRRHESGELAKRLIRDVGGRYAALLPFERPFLTPELYANPRLLRLLPALLGSDWCIGSLEVVISRPGAGRQHQHIDGPIRFDRLVGGKKVPYRGDLSRLPPYALGLATPLVDVDEENGPTAIWKGSHKTALRPRPPGEAEVGRRFREERVVGKLGRSYLFDYRVFHGGLPNFSREPRPLLMLVFVRPWFRDPNLMEIEPSLIISERTLARVPARHRRRFMLAPAARRSFRR